MASLDILCFNPFNIKNKIMKIEHKKIFRGPLKILKNISWPINICLKYFMTPTKTLRSPSYILYVRSLIWMFNSIRSYRKINILHKSSLRLCHNEYTSNYGELLNINMA